jgi:hypothetical protein
MKPKSERTLILAGSLFLAGLIIADVLTQHLNQLKLSNEEADSTQTNSSSYPHGEQEVETGKASKKRSVLGLGEKDEANVNGKPVSIALGSKEPDSFIAEVTSPPPVQSSKIQEETELPFEHGGVMGKYQYVTSDIPQTQFNIFYNALNPHGRWFRHSNFGTCWIPQKSQQNPQWRPYLNDGRWTYTKSGWLWHSDYRWGGYPFHYGRWFHTSKGWAWKPEGDWSTAWVSWRNAGEHCGWAPVPPVHSDTSSSKSKKQNSKPKSVSTNFSSPLSEDHFVFLQKKNLFEASLYSKILNAEKARSVFRNSKPADRFARGKDQRIGNHGISANMLLPWMQSNQQNHVDYQKASNSTQIPGTNHGPKGTTANGRDSTFQNPLATQPSLNTGQINVPPSLSRQGAIPPRQVPSNIQLTPQNRMNNIKKAEQRMTNPTAPGKVYTPLKNQQSR